MENLTDLISPAIAVFALLNISTASACSSSLTWLDEVCSIQISPCGIFSLSLFCIASESIAFTVTGSELLPLNS